jgi:LuxR family maltose regulon positive regulatory protein
LADTVENLYLAQASLGSQRRFVLALCYQNRGLSKKACETAEAANAFVLEGQNPYLTAVAQAFEAELALQQGRLNEASGWARQFYPEPFRSMPWFYVPQLTLAKVLLAENTSESLPKAANLLDRLHDFVVSIHSKRFQIDVLALQALLHDAQEEEPVALEKLAESLALAEPGGGIRNFVDLGPPMADLLKRLLKKNVAVDYITRLLAAFKADEQLVASEVPESQVALKRSVRLQPLVDPLTNRELDILDLIAERLQSKEIADKLCVSPETVKSHLKNIYQKLSVGNRRAAVEKAKSLGILISS